MAGRSSSRRIADRVAKTRPNESETVRELRRQVGLLERRISKLRSKEEIILDAVDSVLRDAMPRLEIPEADYKTPARGNEEIAILHLSDLQLGKVTKTYDTAVAEERVMLACQKTAEITDLRRSQAKIRRVHVYLGGDMVEGEDIFPHQAHEIDSPLYEQACVNGPRILTRAILLLLRHFSSVRVLTVPGNHGRNGPRHTRSSPRTNWDQVLYHTLHTILFGLPEHPRRDLAKRLEFRLSEEFWAVDRVWDWGNLLVHGHQITGGFAGFPFYGAAKKAWGWIDAIEEPWDNLFFGHFHTPTFGTLGHRKFYANGTLESDNEFAKEQLAACGVPAQRLCFMDDDYGIISDDVLELVRRIPSRERSRGR